MLQLADIRFGYPDGPFVLDGVSIELKRGEVVALFGKSGSGKSTLLKLAAGLEHPLSGRVLLDGELLTKPSGRIGMMFQGYALFEWYSVAGNIAVARRMAGLPLSADAVADLLDLVGLEQKAGAYPGTLSGGMRQRLALARALATEPSHLLLDEPFAALDLNTKSEIAKFTFASLRRRGISALVVAHEPEAVLPYCDRAYVLTGSPPREMLTLPLKGNTQDGAPGSLEYVTRKIRSML